MNQWWDSMSGSLHVFYLIAFLGCLLLLAQTVLMLLGLHHLDAHAEASAGAVGAHDSGLKFLSLRTITAFCVGMGWVGVITLKAQFGLGVAVVAASCAGLAMGWSMVWLMRSTRILASDGSLDYANAVQGIGTVIVSIQAEGRTGGQIEILVQGRLAVVHAISEPGVGAIPPGTKVRVLALADQTTLRVAPA